MQFNLKYIYIVVFASLAAWAIFAYVTTTQIIESQQEYANIINISGKQRMLSQKIPLVATRYYDSRDKEVKQHLISLYTLMKLDHNRITQQFTHSAETKVIYYNEPVQLDAKVHHYLKLIEKFIEGEKLSALYEIDSFSFTLLPLLDDAVTIFESESALKTKQLLGRELFILLGTLLTLIIESVLIVIPAIKQASIHAEELNQLVKDRTLELEKISVTDKLTNLCNRRKIDETINFELERAKRNNTCFSLVMIDIDKFKNVNDKYGHKVGDYVLQEVARILEANVRKADMLGRWGGEEFLIIDTAQHPEKVIDFAEKIRKAIEGHKFKTVGQITCSFGVTHYAENDTDASILIRVDKALYKAKESGRNCTREIKV